MLLLPVLSTIIFLFCNESAGQFDNNTKPFNVTVIVLLSAVHVTPLFSLSAASSSNETPAFKSIIPSSCSTSYSVESMSPIHSVAFILSVEFMLSVVFILSALFFLSSVSVFSVFSVFTVSFVLFSFVSFSFVSFSFVSSFFPSFSSLSISSVFSSLSTAL